MVERLKHEGTSHSSSDLLKIVVKMGGQLVSTGFQTGWCDTSLGLVLFSYSAPRRPGAHPLHWSEVQVWGRGGLLEVLMVVWRGVQGGCGVYIQICNRTHSDCLPVVDSPQCWGMVSCNWWCLPYLSTLKQNHWKRIGSLAYRNTSSLLLGSPFPVCIWSCLYKTLSTVL